MPVHATNQEHNALSTSRSHPNTGVRPTVTSPQPLRALERRPSASGAGRSRSPTSNTSFHDLAHQGKRQLNSLMTFLDKSGSVKESLGSRENNALRTVRLKRELDESGKSWTCLCVLLVLTSLPRQGKHPTPKACCVYLTSN